MKRGYQGKKQKRIRRIRAKIYGTGSRPRLSVFRSNKYIYGQIINDKRGHTILAVRDKEIVKGNSKQISKLERARKVGLLLAKKAKNKKIKMVVFDRNGYAYKGRVKALAESAREGGMEF